MEELIYLSSAKLNQFKSRPGRLRAVISSAEIKIPFMEGKVAFDRVSDPDSNAAFQRLVKVKRQLLQSDRMLHWYEDEDLEPGDWMQFEMQVRSGVIDNGMHRLFFATNTVSNEVDLLLHGSPNNLVGSTPNSLLPSTALASTVDDLGTFLRASETDRLRAGTEEDLVRSARSITSLLESSAIGRAYVEGWARVSIRHREAPSRVLLVGSPLYIQLIDRPIED